MPSSFSIARVVVLWLLPSVVTTFAIAQRPNVLILLADDQRADTVAALGNPDIQTPSLDELARGGCHIQSAYCLGANMGAVCRPSRNMLLSGRTYFRWTHPSDGSRPTRNAPATDRTLPAIFNAAGYETYHHGKRGNTAELIHHQFNHSQYLNDFDARWAMTAGEEIVDDAIAFLDRRKRPASPWLMYLAFATPHDPRAASADALDAYDPMTITLPANVAPVHPFDNGAVLIRDEWTAVWPRSKSVLRGEWHDYYATITTLDGNIGRLIADLKRRGEFENTIVVFTSDHGLAMGSHGLMGKQSVYEAAYKAPMVLHGPGVKRGAAADPVYLLDLFPTLCDLAGVAKPDGIDGRSFADMVRGDADGPRDEVLLAYTDTQRAVRRNDWKLIRYPKIDHVQLFNLERDPDETHDLAGDATQQDRIASLTESMGRLQEELGDPLQLQVDASADSSFQPPPMRMADPRRPDFVDHKPGADDLHSTLVAGYTNQPESEPFTVMCDPGESITAISVGTTRLDRSVVTGLRFDVVGRKSDSGRRSTIIAGDPNSRWTPLLDEIKRGNPPVGIHGASGHVIDSLGFILADGKTSPPMGGRGGDTRFRIEIGGVDPAGAFCGFHGTIVEWNGRPAIESLGLLFFPVE